MSMNNRFRVSIKDILAEQSPPDEPSVDAAELIQATAEDAARAEDIAELEDVAAQLGRYRTIVEDSLEDQGIEPRSATILQVGLTQTLDRIGTRIDTPSLESFTSPSSCMQNTYVTLESIDGKLAEINQAIKNLQGVTA